MCPGTEESGCRAAATTGIKLMSHEKELLKVLHVDEEVQRRLEGGVSVWMWKKLRAGHEETYCGTEHILSTY